MALELALNCADIIFQSFHMEYLIPKLCKKLIQNEIYMIKFVTDSKSLYLFYNLIVEFGRQ